MTDEQIVTTKIAQPVHITISRNSKGDIQYEVSVHMATEEETQAAIFRIEKRIREEFKGQLAGEATH